MSRKTAVGAVDAWIEKRAIEGRSTGRCQLCLNNDVREALRKLLPHVLMGSPGVSFAAIADRFLPTFGIRVADNTVSRHFKQHEQALYAEIEASLEK